MIKIQAAQRIQAGWATNRLADAIKGDAEAVNDVPKIVDDAVRNLTSQLHGAKGKIESLSGEFGNPKMLKRELQELQKLLTALGL
jgi:hypothetical protein